MAGGILALCIIFVGIPAILIIFTLLLVKDWLFRR